MVHSVSKRHNRLAESHEKSLRNRNRAYPYRTRAVLGIHETLKDVTVIGPTRSVTYIVPSSVPKSKSHHAMRLVMVEVDGEDCGPRLVAAERLEEEP